MNHRNYREHGWIQGAGFDARMGTHRIPFKDLLAEGPATSGRFYEKVRQTLKYLGSIGGLPDGVRAEDLTLPTITLLNALQVSSVNRLQCLDDGSRAFHAMVLNRIHTPGAHIRIESAKQIDFLIRTRLVIPEAGSNFLLSELGKIFMELFLRAAASNFPDIQ